MYPFLQPHFAKKLCFSFLLLMITAVAQAQPMNNEWINYSQTYYKFKIVKNGVVHISQPVLAANGMGSVAAQNFQLFRNGVQVPMYTSIASGTLSASDYLEFYGVINDGKPDNVMYYDPAFQLNNRPSLETDSSTYFLTYSTTQGGLRYVAGTNNVAGNTLNPEPYLMYTEKYDFKDMINRGYADPSPGEYIYSSSYDSGEMLSSNEIYSYLNSGYSFPEVYKRNFYPYAQGSCTLKAAAMGTALNARSVEFRLNNNLLGTMNLNTFEAKAQTYTNISLSSIPNGVGSFIIKNLCANANDRIAVSYMDITYPRLFNFDNQTSFEFELPASATGRYLEITNFNRGTVLPVLYDLSNNRRYVADVNAAGIIRFALPYTEAATSYVLVSENASVITNVASMQQRSFINYSAASLQGNYLIISNSALYTPVGGSNPVEQYRLYRSSASGGTYNAKTYDIDQLEDQFAFGIHKHPLSIRNFLRYARQNFSAAPKFAFIIGKGVSYQDYRPQQNQPYADQLNLVPTFGYPGSDVLLSAVGSNPYPLTPIGRLSAVNGQEIVDYLAKVKTYEAFQTNTSQTQQDKLWAKNVVHVIGTSDAGTATYIAPYMDDYANIIQDTLFGGSVTTLNKYSSGTATTINTQLIDNLFQTGISLLTYFGHSSATALDYNLADPNSYNNPNKYPMFLLLGCYAGNIFDMDVNRLSIRATISEKYILTPNRGAIGMIASTSYGLVDALGRYSKGFYQSVARAGYGQSVGKNMQDAILYSQSLLGLTDFYTRLHAEQQTLHGDPAIKINYNLQPDYSIEQPNIFINPTLVSVAESSFKVKAYYYNLGKAINDSITVQVKRQYPQSDIYPNGFTDIVYTKKISATRYMDSLEITLPVIANRDKGTNRITVSVETESRIAELSETNNTASRDVVIFEDEMRPVYPYNFAIVNKQGIKLVANTSSPVATARPYRMELDTTELFNSPLKVTRNVTAAGGITEFDPGITFSDSTVYYWRLAAVPATGTPDRWNTSSFVYLARSLSTGYNQSHVYQHLKSGVDKISIDSTSRKWNFTTHQNNLFITHSVYPVSGTESIHFSISVNGNNDIRLSCLGHSLIFNVFDPITFKPWLNRNPSSQFGSSSNSCDNRTQWNYEWDDRTPANRDSMKRFMDAIPSGYYVVVRKVLTDPYANETFAPIWLSDEQTTGAGNSLYSRLKATGFTQIDSFNRPRIFTLLYRKGDPSFTKWKFSDGLERIEMNTNCPTPDTLGYVTSPLFGPARSWKSVEWRGETQDTRAGDQPIVSVIGVNNAGNETPLYNLSTTQQNFDLSTVDSTLYPYLRLRLRNVDSINGTAWNLRYWRLLYNPVPEGALAANLLFTAKDSVDQAENYTFTIPFKNISDTKFSDSIKVKMVILDQNNVPHQIPFGRKKALQSGDTTTVSITLDTRSYPGTNNLYMEMNPVDSTPEPEQCHFNNFSYRYFYLLPDNYNALMDVTFDGVHILNKDIVSSKPHIQIKLKDESKFLLLNDTSLMKLTLRYPDGSTHSYRFGTDTLRFTPAMSGADNTSTIDFYPALDQDADLGFYDLTVSGKDKLNNASGPSSYNVSFQVFNKPMVSNLFNYPNPFTTSTAFVFTITGNEIPQEFKVQILTVTGKIVREITKPELGPLNIGRNITEYKWDGTDQYGSKLANGVYLYRVVTSLNGKKLDHFRINDDFNQNIQDQTDKYFNKGYGKMYLMR